MGYLYDGRKHSSGVRIECKAVLERVSF